MWVCLQLYLQELFGPEAVEDFKQTLQQCECLIDVIAPLCADDVSDLADRVCHVLGCRPALTWSHHLFTLFVQWSSVFSWLSLGLFYACKAS